MLLLLVTELDFDAVSQERVGFNWSCNRPTVPKSLLKLKGKVIVTLGKQVLKLLLLILYFYEVHVSICFV